MRKNEIINMWLRYMLRLMKERKGFVGQLSKEGHIRKGVFSTSVENIARNINSAEHLARMILLWALDSELMDDDRFEEGWAELGRYARKLMAEHGKTFCQLYKK